MADTASDKALRVCVASHFAARPAVTITELPRWPGPAACGLAPSDRIPIRRRGESDPCQPGRGARAAGPGRSLTAAGDGLGKLAQWSG